MPSSFVVGLAIPSAEVDGKPAMSARNGSCTVCDLAPGPHEFRLQSNGNRAAPDVVFVADVTQNQRQFYSSSTDAGSAYVVGSMGIATINRHFIQVKQEFADREMGTVLYSGSWP